MGGKRERSKPKRKLKKRTKFTILAWYAIAVLILNAKGHTVDAVLTGGWFSAWTAELAILYGIKIKDKPEASASEEEAQG